MNLARVASLLTAASLVGGLSSCNKEQQEPPRSPLKFPVIEAPSTVADIIINPAKLRSGINEGSRTSSFGEALPDLKTTTTSSPKDFHPSEYNYIPGSKFDVLTPGNEGYPRIYVDRSNHVIVVQEVTGTSILVSQELERAKEGTGTLKTKDGKHSTIVYKFVLPDGSIDEKLRVVEFAQDSNYKKPAWVLSKKATQKIPNGASVDTNGEIAKLSNQPKGTDGVRLEDAVFTNQQLGTVAFYVVTVCSGGKEEKMYADLGGKITRNIPGTEEENKEGQEPHPVEGRTIPAIPTEFAKYLNRFGY